MLAFPPCDNSHALRWHERLPAHGITSSLSPRTDWTPELILSYFQLIRQVRNIVSQHPGWLARLQTLKRFQHQRLALTYADLRTHARWADATQYFLEELYGPQDHSLRDAQFERVVPALCKLFPESVVQAVATMARLHALSEWLDADLAAQIGFQATQAAEADTGRENQAEPAPRLSISANSYANAWQTAYGLGRAAERQTQLNLLIELGKELDRLTRKPLLRHALHWMRTPARAAGLQALQTMLERGFDTFHSLGGAAEFLQLVETRELALMHALDQGHAAPLEQLMSVMYE
jgi:hypothetical protein